MSDIAIRILLLEDDQALAQVLSRAMQHRGHVIKWVGDLASFGEIIATSEDYQLVIMDLKLEQGSSLHLINQVRIRYPLARIFIVTGYASIATTVEAIKQGADDYLPKPVTAEEILKAYWGRKEPEHDVPEDILSPRQLEWEHIQRILQQNEGNISKTAKMLDMHRRTLQRKLQKKPGSHQGEK